MFGIRKPYPTPNTSREKLVANTKKMIDAIKKSFPDELINKLNYSLCIKTEVTYMAQVSENDIN